MPRAPKKCGRQGCHTRVIGHTYCQPHAAAARAASSWGRGSTRQSRRERELVLDRDSNCYLRYDGCTSIATEDDHVTPRWRGGTDELSNRRGACHHCHGIKSRREALEARTGAGEPPPPF